MTERKLGYLVVGSCGDCDGEFDTPAEVAGWVASRGEDKEQIARSISALGPGERYAHSDRHGTHIVFCVYAPEDE